MSDSNSNSFNSLRKFIWPIEGYEHKKFLPMAFMMFCILMNYSTLRSLKDGFVVTEIGAEAISFIKTYIVLPSAILVMIFYTKLLNLMDTKKVFYVMTSLFIIYFFIYAFFLYPNPHLIHPNPEYIEALANQYPNFKWFIRVIGKWGYSSFYVMSELWGSVMLSVLFWGFANTTTRPEEAKRFYSMYGIIGNLGLVATGYMLSHFLKPLSSDGSAVEYIFAPLFRALEWLSQFMPGNSKFSPVFIMSIVNGLMIIFFYWWINKFVLTDPRLYDGTGTKSKKNKVKLSMSDSFKMIFSSKYLGLVAMLVIAYGISTNLVEGVWKSKIKELYPDKETYTMYMAGFQKWQGMASILFMFVGANILRTVSWKKAAFFTPMMIFFTGLIFFGLVFLGDKVGGYLPAALIMSPLAIAVFIGAIQNILSKATKYSLFDSTKEMAYIPLDEEMQTKGKSAVELIAGRGGKTGGGFIQSTVFMLFPALSFVEAIPTFATIFFVIVLLWLYSIGALSKLYESQLKIWKTQKAQDKASS